ncbi:hypothetical protein ACGFIW_25260 [Micromonospora sp. NPDC048935]|uniref:hypothetical protein n=1 Tax=Micromonospora sp. NPDC048935 TaxID=3364262 RepID=UPI0037120D4E
MGERVGLIPLPSQQSRTGLAESPGYVNLDNSADNFERNSNDYFGPFSWFDIGRPDFIGIYKGSNGSEWYPEHAQIYARSGTPPCSAFPAG